MPRLIRTALEAAKYPHHQKDQLSAMLESHQKHGAITYTGMKDDKASQSTKAGALSTSLLI